MTVVCLVRVQPGEQHGRLHLRARDAAARTRCPASASLPTIVSGACPSSVVTSPPIRRSGSAMRSIGRVRSDSSPVSDEASLLPREHAGKEADQRAGVRAVDRAVRRAQSRAGRRRATRSSSSPSSSTSTPSARIACTVAIVSSERPKPVTCVVALGDAAEHDGAVRDRLVAGHGDVTDDRDGRIDLHLSLSRSCVP